MIPLRLIGRTHYRPYVTFALVVINCAIFLLELVWLSQGDLNRIIITHGYNACRIGTDPLGDVLASIVTSMFLHGGWAHLLGNMLFLWIFGGRVEEYFGHRNFLIFYLASGLGATIAFQLTNNHICIPAIGASGAISGVLGAFIVLYPNVKVKTIVVFFRFLFATYDIRALYMLGYWFIIQLFYGILSLQPNGAAFGGIAFWAHIGGFIAGVAIVAVAMNFKQPPSASPLAPEND